MDKVTVYESKHFSREGNVVITVENSVFNGRPGTVLSLEEVIELRDVLNELLGE